MLKMKSFKPIVKLQRYKKYSNAFGVKTTGLANHQITFDFSLILVWNSVNFFLRNEKNIQIKIGESE